jgi:hypothetical protein
MDNLLRLRLGSKPGQRLAGQLVDYFDRLYVNVTWEAG